MVPVLPGKNYWLEVASGLEYEIIHIILRFKSLKKY